MSHPVEPGSLFPLSLFQPDQDDNGSAPQRELTTVLRKQAEHTLKVNKLQDSHTLVTGERKKDERKHKQRGKKEATAPKPCALMEGDRSAANPKSKL